MSLSRNARMAFGISVFVLPLIGCAKVERPIVSTPVAPVDPTAAWQAKLNAARRAEKSGDLRSAEKAYQEALAEAEKHWPDDQRLASALNHLGEFYQRHDRLDDAEPVFRRSLALVEKLFGADAKEAAPVLENLAAIEQRQGKHAEAEAHYRREIAIWEKTGSAGVDLLFPLHNLARLYADQGRSKESEATYQRGVAVAEEAKGKDSAETAVFLDGLAELYREQKKYQDAETLYRRALEIREKKLGKDHPDVAEVLEHYSALLNKTGRAGEAAQMELRAQVIRAGQR